MSSISPQPGADMPPDFETRMPADLDVRVCYRHPDRETGVSCSNCGRPICHECMIPAPVGFQCPDCVRGQRAARGSRARVVTRAQTRSRWQAGGMLGSRGFTATKALIAINVAVFLAELLFGEARLTYRWGMLPSAVAQQHQYYRMVTSMFLHAGIFHILFNMWALLIIGEFLEAVLGKARFLTIYFISGLAGSVLILLAAPNESTIGASGAIFGVFSALAVYAYLNRSRDFMARGILNQVVFLLIINLVITFVPFGGLRISWQAHVGGLIGGAAVMAAMMLGGPRDPRGEYNGVDWAVLCVAAVAIAGLTALGVAVY